MNIYESVEKYAKVLKMPLETAQIRIDCFSKIRAKMKETQRCPKCHKYALSVELGEFECGIPSWIYCENTNVKNVGEDGQEYVMECDFTDSVESKYLFAFEHDFDTVLMMLSAVNINNKQNVLDFIGCSWDEFVKTDTESLTNWCDNNILK